MINTLRRHATVATCALLLLAVLAGCGEQITLKNAAPRVTWVAVEPVEDDRALLTVWVQDIDGDSVDLYVDVVSGADALPFVEHPGSYGLIGLPTRDAQLDPNGQPHQVLWDTGDLSGEVRLRMQPDDRPFADRAGQGQIVETPPFDVRVGLPEPVRAVIVDG